MFKKLPREGAHGEMNFVHFWEINSKTVYFLLCLCYVILMWDSDNKPLVEGADHADYINADRRPCRKFGRNTLTPTGHCAGSLVIADPPHGSEDDGATLTPTGDRAGSLVATPVLFSLRTQQILIVFSAIPAGRWDTNYAP